MCEHVAEAPVCSADGAVAADQELEVRRCIDAQLTPPGPGVDGVAIAVVDDIVDEAVTLVARSRQLHSDALGEGDVDADGEQIGRASCRERVCQYVKISVVAVALKKKSDNIEVENRQKDQP